MNWVEQLRASCRGFPPRCRPGRRRALKAVSLSGDQTVSVIRAFTHFSHLANLAEDRHHIRRRRARANGNNQEGSIERPNACLGHWHCAQDHRGRWRQLRGAGAHRPPHRSAAQETSWTPSATSPSCSPRATTSWRPALQQCQRRAHPARAGQPTKRNCAPRVAVMADAAAALLKLTVADEIENALSHYEATFLREIPGRSMPTWKARLGQYPVHSFRAWANGLAATATATPTSPRKRCNTR